MTSSAETAATSQERHLRFPEVVSVHESGGDVVITFRCVGGEISTVSFPKEETKFMLSCFVRLYGRE
jgi:hypothetical protein